MLNTFKYLFLLFGSIGIFNSYALTLGSYNETHNLPGYLNFDKNSDVYNGPLEQKNRNDNVNRMTPSQMVESFFENGEISQKKLNHFKNQVLYFRYQAKIAFCQQNPSKEIRDNLDCRESRHLNSIEKDFSDKAITKAIDFIILKINESKLLSHGVTKTNINEESSQKFLSSLFDALEVYEAVKGEDATLGGITGLPAMVLKGARLIQSSNRIKQDRPHAANLMRVSGVGANSNNLFYSENELNHLVSNHVDLSLLNPNDSGYWRRPKKSISKFDTRNYDLQDLDSFKKILKENEIEELTNPDKIIKVVYTGKLPSGGTTPKVDVVYKKNKFKLKFIPDKMGGLRTSDPIIELMRLFQGSEVNIEPAVNNLAAALGFSIDPTYYKKKVHIYFPDEVYEKNQFEEYTQSFLKELSAKHQLEMNPASAFQNIKIDEKGKKYFEVKAVSIEHKSSKNTDLNIGFFVRSGMGKDLKREHRGFALFMAWIMDIDSKDDNDKVKLVPYTTENGQLSYKVVLSSSDMGASLAGNNPNVFNYDFVKSVKYKHGDVSEVEFNYRRIYDLKIINAVNIDDARWMARLMGQLTYEQIKNAFLSGGYPTLVAEYYTQLMIMKRSQLISALGIMHTSFNDDSGERVELLPGGEFQDTIPGYENYFVNGKLYDPNNTLKNPEVDIGNRMWGNSFSTIAGDPKSVWEYMGLGILKKMYGVAQSTLLSNLSLTDKGLTLFPLGLTGGDLLAKNCQNNCFMHGMVTGANLFIPYRFVIPNPNKNQENKYWLVDLFRVGVFIGHNGDSLLGDLGIDSISQFTIGFTGKVYKISEYIKIKPVLNEASILHEIGQWVSMPAMPIKYARQSFVDKMEKGEILIHSSYYGLQATSVFRPQFGLPISIGPAIRLTGEMLTANRVTLLKDDQYEVLANWGKLKESTKSARLNLIDFLIQVPVLEMQLKKLNKIETTYKFQLNDSNQRNLLMNNLGATTPENIPTNMKMQLRATDLERRRFTFNLFGLYVKQHSKSKIEVDFKDFKENISATDLALEKRYMTKKLHHEDFSKRERIVKASINSLDDLYVKINFKHELPGAKKKDFIELYHHYSPILPEKFIAFDPNAVKNYFGDLKLDSTVIFGKEALSELFHPLITAHSMCLKYAVTRRVGNPNQACKDVSQKVERIKIKNKMNDDGVDEDSLEDDFEEIWDEYSEARVAYWNIKLTKDPKSKKNKKRIYKNLGEIIDLFGDSKYFKYRTLKFLISITSKQNFHRKSSISSSLDAFPGAIDQIHESPWSRGEMEPTARMMSDRPDLAFEIFSDRIHQAVGPYFLNYQVEL